MQAPTITTGTPSKRSLSTFQRQLVELMQHINFGRIEGLEIRAGQPVLHPRPRITREIKFGGENGPRAESVKAEFALKSQVIDLFAQFEEMGDGVIACIEVQRGLPFRMTVVEEVRA